VPTGVPRLLAFAHPLAALVVLGLLAYVASLGLRSRERVGAHLRPRHRRLAPWAYGLTLANFAGGVLSTWLLRPDLEHDQTHTHFQIGLAIVALLTTAALTSRWLARSRAARQLHPILGLLALLLAGLQVFFGMPMVPL
jgi:heme A synthase